MLQNETQAKQGGGEGSSVGETGVGGEVSGGLLVAASVVASEEVRLDPHALIEGADDGGLLDEGEGLFGKFEHGFGDEVADPGDECVACLGQSTIRVEGDGEREFG